MAAAVATEGAAPSSALSATAPEFRPSSSSASSSSISSFCEDLVKAREKWLYKRIFVDDEGGLVHYVGPVVTSKKSTTIWLGIEWDSETRGKHDGSVTSESGAIVRYFTCASGKGSFIKPVKASLGRDLLTVVKERFSFERAKSDLIEQRKIEEQSGFKVEFVGWDKQTRHLCDLKSKQTLCLDRSDVSFIDDVTLKELKELVPNLQHLEMTECMFHDWSSLRYCYVFDHLKQLTLSCNPLTSRYFANGKIESKEALLSLKNAFPNLCQLSLNRSITMAETCLNWNPLWFVIYQLALIGAFPKLTHLSMAVNDIRHLKIPENPFELLKEFYDHVYSGKHDCHHHHSAVPPKTSSSVIVDGVSVSEIETTMKKKKKKDEEDESERAYGYATELVDCDTEEFVRIFAGLTHVNLGGNLLSDWDEILRLFGSLKQLDKLEVHGNQLAEISFPLPSDEDIIAITAEGTSSDSKSEDMEDDDSPLPFPKLTKLSLKRNQFADLRMLDALNRFPLLNDVTTLGNPISREIGDSKMRDLTIAKIAKLETCNGSEVTRNERNDAELYYLKYINQCAMASESLTKLKEQSEAEAKQAALSSQSASLASETLDENVAQKVALESEWANAIDAQFGRYKELVLKHGAQKVRKKREESFDTCFVKIKSMDPESITVAPLQKRLPLSMSVGQLKMLCKRVFKLDTRFQRLMLKNPGASFPSDMDDDSQPLSFYNVKDGCTILMQSSDFSGK